MKGIVYKSTGSWFTVKAISGDFYNCRIKGKFRIKGIKSTNPVAVGDIVDFEIEKKGDETIGIIYGIEDRKNYIIRKSVKLSKQTHIIASNLDQVFLLVTLKNPKTYTIFIDRFLATAEAYDIPAVILFNKIDAYTFVEKEPDDLTPATKENLSLEDLKKTWMAQSDIPALFISAIKKQNIEEFKKVLYEQVKKIHMVRYPYNDFLYSIDE